MLAAAKLTCRLQASTADQKAINIRLLGEITAILLVHGATVDHTSIVSSLGGDGRAKPLADGGVNLLGLLSGGDLAGSDSPVDLLA